MEMYNFIKRCLSTIIIAPFVILLIYLGGGIFLFLVFSIVILMSYEWNDLTRNHPNKILWSLIGILYISLPALSMIYIRQQDNGLEILLSIILIVCTTDIGGYIFGKIFKNTILGKRIFPKTSPNKTWIGSLGGIILSLSMFKIVIFSLTEIIIISITAQIGDYIESYIKRKFNIKDSGCIIPGHGGVLDRVDSLLLVVTLYTFIRYIQTISCIFFIS